MVTYTTTYSLAKPTVGDDEDVWGGYLNGNFDSIESLLKGTTALTAIDVTGNITVGGTVDGRDIAADGSKLDGIENGATADQTKADIDALGIDAATLDSLDSTQFLRSDAADTTTGALTIATTGGGALTLKDTNGAGTSAASWIEFDDSSNTRVGYVGMGTTSNGNNFLYAEAGSPVLASANASAPLYLNGSVYTTIWHAGNDGSGSGLDADTVDGIQASSFLRSDAADTTTGNITISKTNGRLVFDETAYGTGNSGLSFETSANQDLTILHEISDGDLPAAGQGLLIASSGTTAATVHMQLVDGGDYYSGSNKVWHAGNDGSGSGLDADTLDGVEGANYLRSDQADTFNGNLTISSTGTIGGSTLTNGYLQVTDGSNTLAMDSNEIVSNSTLYVKPLAGTLELGGSQTTNFGSNVNINGNLNAVDNVYLAGSLYHEGDTDTRLLFGTNTITLQTGGSSEVTVNASGVRLGDTGNGYFQPVTGSYGSVQIDGGAHNGWEGYSIGGRAVFMHNNSTSMGLYDDVNNHWAVNHTFNGATQLYHDGSSKIQTTSTGANITGDLNAVNNIYLASTMYHAGDTDTYIDFDTNQINFVTGGATEMQINGDGVFLNGAALHEEYVALSGTTPTCDPNSGGAFSLTLSGNTTFTFGGTTASWSTGFIVELTGHASTAYTVTWPTSVEWAGGTAPDAPAVGETDIYVFWTRDGGTTWYGVQSIDAAA